MQALMLAAGMGKRLGRYTKNATKCMVPVNGKTLIEYAIEALVKNNIKKMVIVVGYKSDVLIDFIHSNLIDNAFRPSITSFREISCPHIGTPWVLHFY